MEITKRSIKFQNTNTKKSLIKFWVMIIIVDILFYILNWYNSGITFGMSRSTLNRRPDLSVTGANLMLIVIFLIVYSYKMYYERFPITLSFNITRRDFYKSLVVDNIFVAFIFTIIQSILLKIDPVLVRLIGRRPLYDFTVFNTKIDNIFFIMFSIFIGILTIISIWNLIALLNYKFGGKIWIIFIILNGIISKKLSGLGGSKTYSIGEILDSRVDLYQFLKLGTIIGICYALIYIIIKRTNIKHKVG